MTPEAGLSKIHQQIMWNRLIAVVEEQAQTMIRTAFSTTVREAGDLSAGVFDLEGRMLAQAVTGTPGHVNSMAEAVVHFMKKYPPEAMREGDHYISNDPWLCTGHLHDLTVVSPTFRDGRMVALFASTAHIIDIGGRGFGPDGRQVYEEGLYIPIVPVFRGGELNETLMEFIRWNSRTPVELEGDIFSLCACNDAGSRRLLAMMEEFRIDSLDALADSIIETSRQATLQEIAKLPRGSFRGHVRMDGYDHPIDLVATLTVGEDGIDLDYAGTSGTSGYGINVPMSYCRAYSAFGIKVAVAPEIPNNAGSLEPLRIHAPEGCILNAPRPWPVAARHIIGQMLPDVVFGCLHQAMPGKVPAEGASALWNPPLRGGPSTVGAPPAGSNAATPDFDIIMFNSGGTGARPAKDGLNGIAFPSGVRTMPVEATENVAPIVVWQKELRADSGGPGRQRGGTGQLMEIGAQNDAAFACYAMFDRCDNAPKGRDGGRDGARGEVALKSGPRLRPKGQQIIPVGDRLVLRLPGGGGLGDPLERDPARVVADVRDGLVTREAARRDYGVVLTEDGRLDEAATKRERHSRRAAAE